MNTGHHHVIAGNIRNLNWKRQPKDERDYVLPHARATLGVLPSKATTTTKACPPIRDQATYGSCTQNAGTEAMGFVVMVKTGKPDPILSRLFGYYVTRVLVEHQPADDDSGCNVRDVFKAYRKYGVCLESTWPYDDAHFAEPPDDDATTEALEHKAVTFFACPSIHAIKQSIADGWPVIFGFDCYESLQSDETAKTGVIPLPKEGEQQIGGHCMLIDTFDDETDMFSGPNSWGEGWGDHGRFRLPYAYFQQGLASDGTTLRAETV